MRIDVVTVFPGLADGFCSESLLGKARTNGLLDLRLHDPRDHTSDVHRTVDDAPFVAVDFTAEGEGRARTITFTTHVDDEVTAGPEHPIRVTRDPATGEPAPYVHVRAGLEALIDRKSFYRLVDLGEEHDVNGTRQFGVWSGGAFFPFIPAAELGAA